MALPAENMRYTFADCLSWEGEKRIEIINGEPFMMAPPSRIHQEISGELFRQLANFLDGKKCRVYAAPFAVRLFEKDGTSRGMLIRWSSLTCPWSVTATN